MPSRAQTDPIGDGNAEDENEIELQKAVQNDGLWQSQICPGW
jgi:hypothetical protein